MSIKSPLADWLRWYSSISTSRVQSMSLLDDYIVHFGFCYLWFGLHGADSESWAWTLVTETWRHVQCDQMGMCSSINGLTWTWRNMCLWLLQSALVGESDAFNYWHVRACPHFVHRTWIDVPCSHTCGATTHAGAYQRATHNHSRIHHLGTVIYGGEDEVVLSLGCFRER
jgi:hypothetical protein